LDSTLIYLGRNHDFITTSRNLSKRLNEYKSISLYAHLKRKGGCLSGKVYTASPISTILVRKSVVLQTYDVVLYLSDSLLHEAICLQAKSAAGELRSSMLVDVTQWG